MLLSGPLGYFPSWARPPYAGLIQKGADAPRCKNKLAHFWRGFVGLLALWLCGLLTYVCVFETWSANQSIHSNSIQILPHLSCVYVTVWIIWRRFQLASWAHVWSFDLRSILSLDLKITPPAFVFLKTQDLDKTNGLDMNLDSTDSLWIACP